MSSSRSRDLPFAAGVATDRPAAPDPRGAARAAAAAVAGGSDQAALLLLFRRMLQCMARPAEVHRLLQLMADEAARLVQASAAALLTLEPGGEGILRTRIGTGSLAAREGELIPLEGSFAGHAVLSGEVQHTADLAADRRAYRGRERGLPNAPALAVSLTVGGSRAAAILVAREAGAEPFSAADLERIAAATEAFEAALGSAALFEQTRDSRAVLEAWRREQRLADWYVAHETVARADAWVVFQWDREKHEFRWGATLSSVLGYPPAEFGATLPVWSEHVLADDRARLSDEFSRARRDGHALRVHCRMLHRSGVNRQVVLRVPLSTEASAGPLIGVLEDVTDRERLSSHREQRARASAAAEIIRALRHEINNPLAVVIGQIQLLQRDPAVAENPALEQSLRALHEESTRMHELVRRLAALEQHPREPFVTGSGGVNIPGEGR